MAPPSLPHFIEQDLGALQALVDVLHGIGELHAHHGDVVLDALHAALALESTLARLYDDELLLGNVIPRP